MGSISNVFLNKIFESTNWFIIFNFNYINIPAGYGNISPHNTFGRMFMIFYALIGIPVNGFLFAYLGDFFGKTVRTYTHTNKKSIFKLNCLHWIDIDFKMVYVFQFIGIYQRYKSYKIATTKNYIPMRFSLVGRILLYLIPGIVFFIFLPSCLFTYFEDWPYTVSIYYSFVTLTTIGFGDFVPTFQPQQVSWTSRANTINWM